MVHFFEHRLIHVHGGHEGVQMRVPKVTGNSMGLLTGIHHPLLGKNLYAINLCK